MYPDILRNHILEVRSLPDSDAALETRLVDILGDANHPGLAQSVNAMNGAIDAIPHILEQISLAAQQAGIDHLLAPLLHQAANYFLSPDDLIPDRCGTLGLLDDAYLVHAYLHQVNLAYQASSGLPLLQYDPTPTLQVLREILSPLVTTQLDQSVAQRVSQAIQQSQYEQLTQWNQTLQGKTAGPGSWGGSWEDEMARTGAEIGIFFD